MNNQDEFKTLLAMLSNVAKQVENIAERLDRVVQKKEVKLQYIDNSTFIQLFHITPRTAIRWRKEHRIKYRKNHNRIHYKLSDVHNYFEKQSAGDMKKLLEAGWEIAGGQPLLME